MTTLVSENQHTELGGRFPAYDGRDSLFTAGALPFDTKEFEVILPASGDHKGYVNSASPMLAAEVTRYKMLDELCRMDRNYKVVIKHATAISLLQLRMLLAGYPTDIPAEALQVLDTVMRDIVFNKRNDLE